MRYILLVFLVVFSFTASFAQLSVSSQVSSTDAHISTLPDTSVCWLVPMTFTGSSVGTQDPVYTWDMGDGSPVITSGAVDHVYSKPGDYTVKLTVKDATGNIRTTSERVHVVKITAYTVTHDTSVCLAAPMAMHAGAIVEPGSVGYTLGWAPADHIGAPTSASPYFFGVGDFVYTVTASTFFPACNAIDTEAIHSFPPVTLINVTPNRSIPWGSTVQLNAEGAVYYTWLPANGTLDDPNINDPIAAPSDPVTKYTVYGMNTFGCLDSASVTIKMGSMTQFMPTAFTPNGDGINDVFRIVNITYQRLVDFRIFNRWGQQVFQTANREIGWDGTWKGVPQDVGVYTYQLILGFVDGTTKTYTGNVTLVR
jgi:gliding motility-associated-like protein